MFRHKSKSLIASGFVLVLALTVALAGVGLTRMTAIHDHLRLVTEKYNAKADIIFSMRHIVRERALSTYAMFIMDDPFDREEELSQFTNMAAEFIQLRDRLMEIGLEQREQLALDKVLGQVRVYQPLHLALVERITSERLSGVKEEILRHDLLRQRTMLGLLDEMVELERVESEKATAQATREYNSAYLVMVLLTAIIIASGFLIAAYVIYRTRLVEQALAREKERA